MVRHAVHRDGGRAGPGGAKFNVTAQKGALQRVSPPEDFFAFLLRVNQDLNKKEAHDTPGKDMPKAYRKACLDVLASSCY